MRVVMFFAFVGAMLAGCSAPPPIAAPDGVEITPLKSYSKIESRFLIYMAGVEGIGVAHAIDTYRVIYPVTLADGSETKASGLLAMPRGVTPKRIVSFQHGTTTNREVVPSALDIAGVAASIIFAGNGYMLLAPDYLGLGASPGPHAYLVASEEARAVVGLIEAARALPDAPQAPAFLAGFSQGGHASLATMRQMEAAGENVLGTISVASAIDLRNISLVEAMKGGAPSHSTYLAYMAWGYAHHYDHPLTSALTEDYAARVETVLGTPHEPEEVRAALPPENPREMFGADFLEAFDNGGAHWMLDAIATNNVDGWVPRGPVHLFYGTEDKDVSPREAIVGAERFRAAGADVVAVDVGPFEHEPSLVAGAPLMLAWLRELEGE